MTHTERARSYIDAVLTGTIPASKQIKEACRRSKELFERQSDPTFPYFYHADQAERVCNIIQMLPHVKGRWAAQGKKLLLEPWQCWVVTSLYGWLRKDNGTRKYRRVTLVIPRKQGKSLMMAGLLIYHLLFDGETGAECFCGASNLKQAKEIFNAARQMLIMTPEIREFTGCEVNAASIVCPGTNSKAEPVIGRPKDGSNVSFGVIDETHQLRDLALYESFETGTGAREQALLVSVSTAGFGTENPCRELQLQAEKVLYGTVEDEELFAAIWTIDDGVDWKSDLALRMANPNAGISVTMDYLRSQQLSAINNPAKYASFATKHLDITVGASSAYFSLEKWRACTDTVKMDDFAGEDCWVAIDLSQKIDLSAMSTVFRREIDGHPHFYVFSDCFTSEEAVSNNPVYAQWAAKSLLHVNDGNVVDKDAILEVIEGYAAKYKLAEFIFDPFNSAFIEQDIAKLFPNVAQVELLQRAISMTNPMKLLQELIVQQHIRHNGDPVLQNSISNVIALRRGNLIQPGKEKPEQKIDAAVAAIMAVSRAATTTPKKRFRPFAI
ncbi:phage terminase large subunit-like protein [Silvibacterium bohemicum]|uniref:Phage terminase large subunit-like protein n=1 Tax=Silvibacterium bohemicum TaxID=1577686 RepID=A0A841JTR3_9BACT|nr:terminase TerL endonuclease subunit [Silvibacterium bohemicum]MBB6144726.1 phage terminase large subunit-like protein [Silvibacterium bohemicum]